MKKWIIILISFWINIEAQINIEYLNDVPESFKEKYYSQAQEYNQLQVGNFWQYTGDGYYYTEKVVKDTLVNGEKYYKKIIDNDERFVSWERNDSSGNTFMLDFEDVDEDGNHNEELPIDSLELPIYSRYKTYKGSYEYFLPPKDGLSALIYDTLWVVFVNDTVLAKEVQYDFCFCSVIICDKYGVVFSMGDAPPNILTGAIINGKQYGTIVDVKEPKIVLQNVFRLENNFPNPFNPTTTIQYSIPNIGSNFSMINVKLKIYDILGREIRTLVNEKKNPGKYSVSFNANNLSGGVYYYSLAIDTKRITKPMILIK